MTYEDYMLALCIWREARGESQAGKFGVLSVIRNRAEHPGTTWPNDPVEVILQPWQFSCFNPKDNPQVSAFPLRKNAMDWHAWQECLNVVLTPLTADPTQGATYYVVGKYLDSLSPEKRAKMPWFNPDKLTVTIGSHRFYRP